MSLINTDKCWR